MAHRLPCCRLVKPDEVYNLGAQSHVQVSFELPQYTAEASGVVSQLLQMPDCTDGEPSIAMHGRDLSLSCAQPITLSCVMAMCSRSPVIKIHRQLQWLSLDIHARALERSSSRARSG